MFAVQQHKRRLRLTLLAQNLLVRRKLQAVVIHRHYQRVALERILLFHRARERRVRDHRNPDTWRVDVDKLQVRDVVVHLRLADHVVHRQLTAADHRWRRLGDLHLGNGDLLAPLVIAHVRLRLVDRLVVRGRSANRITLLVPHLLHRIMEQRLAVRPDDLLALLVQHRRRLLDVDLLRVRLAGVELLRLLGGLRLRRRLGCLGRLGRLHRHNHRHRNGRRRHHRRCRRRCGRRRLCRIGWRGRGCRGIRRSRRLCRICWSRCRTLRWRRRHRWRLCRICRSRCRTLRWRRRHRWRLCRICRSRCRTLRWRRRHRWRLCRVRRSRCRTLRWRRRGGRSLRRVRRCRRSRWRLRRVRRCCRSRWRLRRVRRSWCRRSRWRLRRICRSWCRRSRWRLRRVRWSCRRCSRWRLRRICRSGCCRCRWRLRRVRRRWCRRCRWYWCRCGCLCCICGCCWSSRCCWRRCRCLRSVRCSRSRRWC